MIQHDDEDFAAIQVLQQLVEREAIELVSSRGITSLASAASSFLLQREGDPERGAAFAAWLIDQAEVADLYADDDQLEQLLQELWDARAARSSPRVEARRDDFEAMLREHPDDLDHRLVYGEWLQAHSDPLGELIARQLAAASEPDNPALQHAAASYASEHAEALFGPLAEYLGSVVRLGWRGGFVETATLGKRLEDPGPYEGPILLRWLLEHRTAILLRELELRPFDHGWGRDQLRALVEVVLERPRPLLRRLAVGHGSHTGVLGELGELAGLDQLLPNLEVLELRVRSVVLERLRHHKLRRLIWHSSIVPKQARALAHFELPKLESLDLSLSLDQLEDMFDQLELPSLRSLRVPGTAEHLDWLACVPWRVGLEQLDLSGGNLEDADVPLLIALRWPRLRRLDVSYNQLGRDGIARLAALGLELVAGGQRSPEPRDEYDDDYYDSVME